MFMLVSYVIIVITGFLPAKGQLLSFCPDPIEGEECSITCTTPDHNKDIFFRKTSDPTSNIASCIGGACGAVNSYTMSQPTGTTTVLSFNHTRGNAEEWLCRYGSSSNTGILKWGTYPTTITATDFPANTNITSEQESNVKLTCLYSENPPIVTLIHTDSGSTSIISSTPVTCTITNETCTDPDFDTYTCKVIISPSYDLLCTETYSLGVSVKISNIQTPSISSALGTGITYECHDEPVNTIDCNVAIIVGASFGSVIACLILTLIIIPLCWKHNRILYIILVVFIVDLVAITVFIWAVLHGADVKKFRSDKSCHGTKGKPDLPRKQSQPLCKVKGKVSPGDEKRVEMPATTEDIILLMYFAVPKGYTINKWITEEQPSIENSPRYVSHKRGTLVVKSATENDNGIYQGILTSDGNEQRVNAVLHVTGKNSVNLVVRALVWRQVKYKNLKNVNDLKDIRHKISNNEIANIPKKKEKEGESKVSIKSVIWKHDGQLEPDLCDFKQGDSDVSPLTVTKKKNPTEDYQCTVEFTNKRSHEYIFIVKFTGALSNRHNAFCSDDVIGVPTILSTKREEKNVILAPLRETKPTAEQYENSLQQATARSAQSTGTEDNAKI